MSAIPLLRRRIECMDRSIAAVADAFGGEGAFDAMVMEGDEFTITHADVPYTPDEHLAIAEPPWRVWFMLKAIRDRMTAKLERMESEL